MLGFQSGGVNRDCDGGGKIAPAGRFEELIELDDSFHVTICNLSGFPRLLRMIEAAKAQIDRTRFMALPVMGRADATIDEHQAIIDALSAGDSDRAVHILTLHLDRSDETMATLFAGGEFYSG